MCEILYDILIEITFSVNIHLLIDTAYLHILTIVSSAAVNMGVKMSLWDTDFISCELIPRSGIAGSYSHSR